MSRLKEGRPVDVGGWVVVLIGLIVSIGWWVSLRIVNIWVCVAIVRSKLLQMNFLVQDVFVPALLAKQ